MKVLYISQSKKPESWWMSKFVLDYDASQGEFVVDYDVSQGKEEIPIPALNAIDDASSKSCKRAPK
ncbi:hypothetical protein KY285_022855 [Solanum tuberosum]|nr:hypothetical protein KY285_022855 [Solanum tuberosum]